MLESTELFGSNHTSHPLRWLWEAIFGPVGDANWDVVHHLIRKSGHFFGYGALRRGVAARLVDDAAALPLPPRTPFLRCWEPLWWPVCDEWHQSYLPNRTGSPWDVLLDCCGAIALLLAAYIYMRLMRPTSTDQDRIGIHHIGCKQTRAHPARGCARLAF